MKNMKNTVSLKPRNRKGTRVLKGKCKGMVRILSMSKDQQRKQEKRLEIKFEILRVQERI